VADADRRILVAEAPREVDEVFPREPLSIVSEAKAVVESNQKRLSGTHIVGILDEFIGRTTPVRFFEVTLVFASLEQEVERFLVGLWAESIPEESRESGRIEGFEPFAQT
jgi:hypothetical protein